MKANILVCGKIGAGKTSLIKAVTQLDTVPDSAIIVNRLKTDGFDIYETDIANFIDADGMESGQTINDYIEFIKEKMINRLNNASVENLIHNVWFCIDSSDEQIQSSDVNFLKVLDDKVLVVLTKYEKMQKNQFDNLVKDLEELISQERIIVVSNVKKTGLEKLLDKALHLIEQCMNGSKEEIQSFTNCWDNYYSKMINRWKEKTNAEADECIKWGACRAATIAIVPLPLADLGPLIVNEAYMIHKLAGIYGYAADKSIIAMLGGVAGGSFAGKLLASFLPGLKSAIAAGVTYGVGKAAKAYFESDMSLDINMLKEKFKLGEKESKTTDWEKIRLLIKNYSKAAVELINFE
ncbi:MAG: GTP-binding DUF697 domain-containing protein [Fusobacteriaceae bacterium]|jgi:uncharacterized protein (DUF697 family)/GTP-binding protein EngB required for normal cell division|nr:GTP-binding DUF697 domain-containing protein [Fusobacteriaceae bacterium]